MPPTTATVVICTYNRVASLRRALASLGAMVVPPDLDWEVLVVDNNSRDGTRDVITGLTRCASAPVRHVFEAAQGLNHARNRGVKEATGELIAFIDDDVVVATDWLVEVRRAFELYPVMCVGGRVLVQTDVTRPPWWHPSYEGALGRFDSGDAPIWAGRDRFRMIGIGANLSFRRSVFSTYGLFRPDLDRRKGKLLMGGDTELYDRLRCNGEGVMYHPGAVVYHCPAPERFTRQYLRRWHFRVGEWRGGRDAAHRAGTAAGLVSIPSAMYRRALSAAYDAVAWRVSGRHGDGFLREIQCISDIGWMFGMLKTARRPRAALRSRRRRSAGPSEPKERSQARGPDASAEA